MMKKRVLSILTALALLLSMLPAHVFAAEETPTYTVTLNAEDSSGRALRSVEIMISHESDGTETYVYTNRWGVATATLPSGDYTAVISYTSGNYSYYAEVPFTVADGNVSVDLQVTQEYSADSAKSTYDRTTYFDHVDIRVNGTYTTNTSTSEVFTTYHIQLTNVSIVVADGSNIIATETYTDTTETYEWRKTGLRVPKSATVSLVCDILYDGKVIKEDYSIVFAGEADFIQAIINCDAHQGLDFIIDPMDIVEVILYDVNYVWTGLPEGLATPPAPSFDYAPGSSHTLDTHWHEGYYILDEATGTLYTFSGWTEWDNTAGDSGSLTESDTAVTVNGDTTIYGLWTATALERAESHLTITKQFVGLDTVPQDYHMLITGPQGGSLRVGLEQFTLDATTGVYSYELPVFDAGTFTITEHSYTATGYSVSPAVVVTENNADHNHIIGDGSYSADTVSITLDPHYLLPAEIMLLADEDICAHLGTVAFTNSYEKILGDAVHNYPTVAINKLDADTGAVLPGVVFTLTDSEGNVITSEATNESGYTYFPSLKPGTYVLDEIVTPDGYLSAEAVFQVVVTEKAPVQQLIGGAFVDVYDYEVAVLVDGVPSVHFNADRLRLAYFNEKISGSLTVTKAFGQNNAFVPESVTMTVTGPEGYEEQVVLNANNGWTATLTGLALGEYTVTETAADEAGYTLETTYSQQTVTIDKEDLVADYDPSAPVAAEAVTVTNTYSKVYADDYPYFADLTILKLREGTEVPLSGAEFTIYSPDGSVAAYGTTDEEGTFLFSGLGSGTYTMKETKAPDTYTPIDTVWTIEVTEVSSEEVRLEDGRFQIVHYYDAVISDDNYDTESNTLTVYNHKAVGELTLTKEFGVNSAYQPDSVTLTVTGPEGFEEQVILSADIGWTATLTNLAFGTYTVTETGAEVEGYELTVTYANATATLDKTNDTAAVTVVNTYSLVVVKPAELRILKLGENGAALAGAVFGLYQGDTLVAQQTTDANGEALFAGFTQAADYTLKELQAPEGYICTDTVWNISVSLKDGSATVAVNEEKGVLESIYQWVVGVTPDGSWDKGILTVINEKQPPVAPPVTYTELSVSKAWHVSDAIDYPDSVEVVLYRDGEVYDTQTLSDENDWCYRWTELDDSYTWTVDEPNVPKDYEKSLKQEDTHVTITNSHVNTHDDSPKTGDASFTGIMLAAAALSGGGLIFTIAKGKKKAE